MLFASKINRNKSVMTEVWNLSEVFFVSFSVDTKQGTFLSIFHYTGYKNQSFLPWKGTSRVEKCFVYFLDTKSCSLGVQGCQGMFLKTVSFSEDFFIVLQTTIHCHWCNYASWPTYSGRVYASKMCSELLGQYRNTSKTSQTHISGSSQSHCQDQE